MAGELGLRGRVLITGGAGFIGRAIMDRAEREEWDADFTIYSRDEQKQDYVSRRFQRASCLLGDIRDRERLRLVATGHDMVIHAGALKYIPQAEFNVSECLQINTYGSQSVIEACRGIVPTVLAISTDKAVMPLNIYGASKMAMERLFCEADTTSDWTRYGVVRYGNVIGSTGSIVPVFKKMAKERGEVTITDDRMTRFWLSADEAVDLILYGLWKLHQPGHKGLIHVPLAKAMRLTDLVDALELGVETKIIGVRPGEKFHEALFSGYEATRIIEGDEDLVSIQPQMVGNVGMTLPPALYNGYTSDAPVAWWGPADVRTAVQLAEGI